VRGFWKFVFKFVLGVGVLALIVGGVFKAFFVDVIVVAHNGMAPTMIVGEEVLMWRGADDPELGDIVVCQHPAGDGRMVMARVVARNGAIVQTVRGQLRVAGDAPDIDFGGDERFYDAEDDHEYSMKTGDLKLGNTTHGFFMPDNYTFSIPETNVPFGGLYLLSDNRMKSAHDSRSFGSIYPASCIGTIFMRWKPIDSYPAHGYLDIID